MEKSKDIGKVEIVIYNKDGGVVLSVMCNSPKDALELLNGLV